MKPGPILDSSEIFLEMIMLYTHNVSGHFSRAQKKEKKRKTPLSSFTMCSRRFKGKAPLVARLRC
jgi:hypothetical protein